MARRRTYLGRSVYLLDCFYNEILVWMCENRKTLDETLQYTKESNSEHYEILNEILADPMSKGFIEDTLKGCNNKPYPEYLDELREARDDMLYGKRSDNNDK